MRACLCDVVAMVGVGVEAGDGGIYPCVLVFQYTLHGSVSLFGNM